MPQKHGWGNEKLRHAFLQKKTEATENALVLRYFQWVTWRETGFFGYSHDIMDARMTSALAPALSPRRGRIVRRAFENLYDWIGRTLICKTRNKRKPFPLLSAFAFGFGAIASKRSKDGRRG
jgi:hypothetical protein